MASRVAVGLVPGVGAAQRAGMPADSGARPRTILVPPLSGAPAAPRRDVPNPRLRPALWTAWEVDLRPAWDWVNPLVMLALAATGVAFIYSAQLERGGTQWFQQLVWLALGAGVYALAGLTDYRFLLRYGMWIYGGAIALLVLLFVPEIATPRFGARRWIDFGPASIQPSEAAKVAILCSIAAVLARTQVKTVRDGFRAILIVGGIVALPMLLILAQPDLGSALVIAPMALAVLFVSNLPRRFFAAALGVVAVLVGVVAWDIRAYDRFLQEHELSPTRDRGAYEGVSWLPLRDYQRNRILAFLAPDRVDPLGIGWNQRQSLISVGSGGLTGKGWTQGTQAQLGYLPPGVAHNDFIFSVLAEEKGFIGSAAVLALFGILLGNSLRIAARARDRFGMLLAVGVTTLLSVHVFVNVAMTIGLMPIKGLPLPLLSYGGSFVLSCCFLLGIVQSVHRFRRAY